MSKPSRMRLSWSVRDGNGRGTLSVGWGRRHVADLWVDAWARGARDGVTWSTWDRRGIGGENATAPDLAFALEEVLVALLRQGFITSLTSAETVAAFNEASSLTKEWRRERDLGGIRWSGLIAAGYLRRWLDEYAVSQRTGVRIETVRAIVGRLRAADERAARGEEGRAVIAFTVSGDPQTKGSAKAFRHKSTGKIIVRNDNARCASWSSAVAWKARLAMGPKKPTPTPVSVTLSFTLARPKTTKLATPRLDIDKLTRAVLDALTGIVYVDDKQVAEVTARKAWGEPGVVIEVSETNNAPGRPASEGER